MSVLLNKRRLVMIGQMQGAAKGAGGGVHVCTLSTASEP